MLDVAPVLSLNANISGITICIHYACAKLRFNGCRKNEFTISALSAGYAAVQKRRYGGFSRACRLLIQRNFCTICRLCIKKATTC